MQKHIKLDDIAVNIVEEYRKKNGSKSFNDALESLIKDYEKNANITENVTKGVSSELSKVLTRIRLGTNTADVNSQVIIEILNAIVYQFNVKPMSTRLGESETVAISKQEIQDKIAYLKQKKDNKRY